VIRFDRRVRALALGLSALAGFVDAIGFVQLGGFFVSFMSGNSTRLAVGLFHSSADWQLAAVLIVTFLAGTVAGSLAGRIFVRRHLAVLMLVTIMLVLSAISASSGWTLLSALLLAAAMGAENATFERVGEVQIGLTYMTGTLVKVGQRIAGAIMGDDPRAWIAYAQLWLALVAGAIGGAATWRFAGPAALWVAACFAAVACYAATRHLDGNARY
jgi:uncharacterized membrane protein YoaK (UPF0700 family)